MHLVTAPLLTPELLENLEEGWVRHRAPLVEHLRPGLSPERIDEITAPLGLRLPVEARIWWTWHDGVDVRLGPRAELGPGLPFLPLEAATGLCRQLREQAVEVWGERADYWWRPSWFPITERLGAIRCDCAVEEGAPTPIFWADSHDHDANGLTNPKLEALGSLVGWWVEALVSGAWRYDHDNDRWDRDRERLPSDRRSSRLI
jgi:hypothetical protein